MNDIVISFPKGKGFSFNGNLSDFAKELANNLKKIDIVATESNIKCCSCVYPDQTNITVLLESIRLSSDKKEISKFQIAVASVINNYGISVSPENVDIINHWHILRDGENVNENNSTEEKSSSNSDFDIKKRAEIYKPIEPNYTFERVIIDEKIKEEINSAIRIGQCKKRVFEEWGLKEIEPHPSTALNFHGEPGTGKTMAAEAVAKELNKKILKVSYADVESKYHGEGPKMLQAIFLSATDNDAVLFFDEADSLLSKRLTNVTDGSAQAINSMRSELLIQLEKFEGIVIFATNLYENYDKAFRSRLHSIKFTTPSESIRKQIWDVHLYPLNDGKPHQLNIPLSSDVNTEYLAKNYDFVGREIRNTVVSTCVYAASHNKNAITQEDLIHECNRLKEEKKKAAEDEQKAKLEQQKEEEAKELSNIELLMKAISPNKRKSNEDDKNISIKETQQLNEKTESKSNASINDDKPKNKRSLKFWQHNKKGKADNKDSTEEK